VADATARLLDSRSGRRVVVLVGKGTTGMVGLAAAGLLREHGLDVSVIVGESPGPDGTLHALSEQASTWAANLDGTVTIFEGTVPDADVVVDGLVGTGLCGPLTGPARAIVHALRLQVAPIISIDVPSGLHPDQGLVGDAVVADLTVAIGQPSPGLFRPGLWPFVGDVYLADLRDGGLVRLVSSPEGGSP
jgi:NAD(P)H-hydrate epimerase